MVNDNFKSALLMYLDRGITGSFVKFHPSKQEKGYVKIEYKPFKRHIFHFPRNVILKDSFNLDDVYEIINPAREEPGVEELIVYILTHESGSRATFFSSEDKRTIAQLKEKNERLNVELATAKSTAKEAVSGFSSGIAQQKSVGRTNNIDLPSAINPHFPTSNSSTGNGQFEDFDEE